MATIVSITIDEALGSSKTKEPSERTLRTRELNQDATDVVKAGGEPELH